MDALEIAELTIDEHIEDKLWVKHALRFAEVEQALMGDDVVVIRSGQQLYDVWGRTDDGLHVLVVIASKGGGSFKVVTARPMNRKEIQWFSKR